jgi:TolB protein
MNRKLFVVMALALVSIFMTTNSFAQLTPSYDWKMFETDHFRIIFHPEVEGLAYEAAVAAEDAYVLWSETLDTAPPAKTDIVVIDVDDSPNGFADTSNLTSWEFSSQVQFASLFGGRVPSNMADVVYHEYWHIADINSVSGVSQTLRPIFGQIILPNDIKPIWNIEGSATYSEDLKFGYSRASWALSAMYMRQMALDDDFPSLDRASSPYSNIGWPTNGMMWYLLGSWFSRYIQEEHGIDSMALINNENSSNLLSTLSYLLSGLIQNYSGVEIYVGPDFETIVENAIGVSIDELYTGFQSWILDQAIVHVDQVTTEGLTSSRPLTSSGFRSGQPKWSPQGNLIAYNHNDPFRRSGIRLVTPQGEDQIAVSAAVIFDNGFDWSPDGSSIIYSSYDQNGPHMTLNDLYLLDLESRDVKRLTEAARAYNPVFTNNGEAVLFGQQGPGDRTRLSRLDLESREIEIIHEFPEDIFLDTFDLSSDGTELVLSLWKRPGYSDLYLMPAEGGELTQITQDANEDFRPTWSSNGEYVLFDSIRDETINIYAMRVSDREFFQVTNVVSGALSPSISPDNSQIAFSSYGSEGYDIHVMNLDPAVWKNVSFNDQAQESWAGFPALDVEVQNYNPYVTMAPKYWMPELTKTSIGLSSDVWDALYRQYYYFDIGYDWSDSAPFGSVFYINEQHLSPISIGLGAGIDAYGNWQSISFDTFPLTGFTRSHDFSLGFERSDYEGESYTVSLSSGFSETFGDDLYWNNINTLASISTTFNAESEGAEGKFVLSLNDLIHLPVIDAAGPHEIATQINLGASNVEGYFGLGGSAGSFIIRGQPRNVIEGSQIVSWNVEYRFPVLTIEKGLGLMPLFIDDLRGAIFVDGGTSWNQSPEEVDAEQIDDQLPAVKSLHKIGLGAELMLSYTTGFWAQRSIRVGIAFGLGEEKSPNYYWGFGTAF